MKRISKLLSFFLALVMVLSLLPAHAFATESTDEGTATTEATVPATEETVSEETTPSSNATVVQTTVYNFSNESQLSDFTLYQSATSAFTVADGVLKPNGTDGEQKAIINSMPDGFDTVSVDIIPGESGTIFAGLYVAAKDVGNSQDEVNSMAFLIQSDFTGWSDAPNRIDIIQGRFNNGFTQISREITETQFSNNLFSGGNKQPLNLKLVFSGDLILLTLSLVSNPSKSVQYIYQVEDEDLVGQIGLRTIGSDTCFDNLSFQHKGPMPENTVIWDFESNEQDDDFTFHQSGTSYFDVAGGKLIPSGNNGIFEAVLAEKVQNIKSVSVDMYPGGSAHFMGGIFVGDTTSSGIAFWAGARRDSTEKKPWNEIVACTVSDYAYTEETTWTNTTFFSGGHHPFNLRLDFEDDQILVTATSLSDPSVVVTGTYAYYANNFDGYIGLIGHSSNISYDNLTITYSDTYTWDFTCSKRNQAEDFTIGDGTGTVTFNGSGLYTSSSGTDNTKLVLLNKELKNLKSVSFDMLPGGSNRFWGGISFQSDAVNYDVNLGGRRTGVKSRMEITTSNSGLTEYETNYFFDSNGNTRNPIHVDITFDDGSMIITATRIDDPTKVLTYTRTDFDAAAFEGKIGFWVCASTHTYDNLSITYTDGYTDTWDFEIDKRSQIDDFTIGEGTGTVTFGGSSLYTSGSTDNGQLVLLNKELKNLKSVSFDMLPGGSNRFWGGVSFQSDAVSYDVNLGGRRTGTKSRMEIVTSNGGLTEYETNYFFDSNGNTRNPIHVDITFDNGSMIITATRIDDPTKVLTYTRTDFDAAAFEGKIGFWVCTSTHTYDNLNIVYEPEVQMPCGSVAEEEVDTTEIHIWDFNDAAQAEEFTIGEGTGSATFDGTGLYTTGSDDNARLVTLNRNWKNISSISFDLISTGSDRFWGGINLSDGTTDFDVFAGGRQTSSENRDNCEVSITGASDKIDDNFFTTGTSNTRNNINVTIVFENGLATVTITRLGTEETYSMTHSAAFDMESFGGQIALWVNESTHIYDNLTVVCDPYDNTGYYFPAGSWDSGKTLTESVKTVEAWVKVPKGIADNTDVSIITTRNYEPFMSLDMTTYGRPCLTWQKEHQTASNFVSEQDIRTGKWTHLAFTVDTENEKVICYINGKVTETWDAPGIEAFTQPTNITPNPTFMVGGSHDNSKTVSRQFKGWIADARIWDKTLTADEVNESLRTRYTVPADGLVFNARLKEPVDGVFTDLSGNEYNLTQFARTFEWIEETVEPGDYSIVVIPDQQIMTNYYPDALNNMYQWIADNREKENIQIVLNEGDMADFCGRVSEWENVKAAWELLPDDLPFIAVPGNHDYDTNSGWNQGYGVREQLTLMNQYFPMSIFENYPTEFGALSRAQGVEDNVANTYQAFEVNGNKYLILALEFVPRDDAVAWANEVIASHPNHQVIMVTHSYVGTMGEFDRYYLWEDLMSQHDNVIMGWSGHVNGSDYIVRREDVGINGNTVYNCLVDFQMHDREFKGLGMVVILRFTEDGKKCTVSYYSTAKGQCLNELNQFTWDIDFEPHAVALADGKGYDTVAEAIAAANDGVVQILQSTDEAIAINTDVTIDLAGCTLSNVTVAEGYSLKLIDTASDSAETVGSATVTGSVEPITQVNGNTYVAIGENNVYTVHCYVAVLTQQVSLGDDLAMNFVVEADKGTTVNVIFNGETIPYDLSTMTADENGKYTISVDLAAAQMTEEIKLQFVNRGVVTLEKTYSVRSYAEEILAGDYPDKTKNLVRWMLNYGAKAQLYFDVNTDNLANAGYELEETTLPTEYEKMSVSGSVEGLKFYGASLVFTNKIAVRFYFTGSVDGVSFGDYEAAQKDGMYYVEVAGINPQDYRNLIALTATKGEEILTVSYSPLNYIVRMSEKGSTELKNLLNALYGYHEAALRYVNEKPFFGTAGSLVTTSRFDLSADTGAKTGITTIDENGTAYGYVDGFSEETFYMESKFHINSILSTESYPKFGLNVISDNIIEYFYVDMSTNLTATVVGRMTSTNNVHDWANAQTATVSGMAFSGEGETVTMAVLKDGADMHLFINGVYALTHTSSISGEAATGVFGFNTGMTLSEYFTDTTEETINAKLALIPAA